MAGPSRRGLPLRISYGRADRKKEKMLQMLKEIVKTEIADAVKRSAEQEKQKTIEDKNRRGRSWRDVATD